MENIVTKKCGKCGEVKPINAFTKNKDREYGVGSSCKTCHNKVSRNWQKANPEKVRQASQKYKKTHSERIKKRLSEWAKANIEKLKEYRRAHWDSELDRQRKKRQANLDKERADSREYYWKNPEKAREYARSWAKANPEKVNQCNANRRARQKNSEGTFTAKEWLALCEKYGNKCLCCGEKKKLTADHVVPLVKGGENYIRNIQPLCLSCNSRKGTKTIDYRTIPESP